MSEILMIDDGAELCSMLSDYLGRRGFSVAAVYRGDEGLKAVLQKTYALVLLDVMLPELDGLEVLRRIRAVSSIHVLLLTACGDDEDRVNGLEMGADDYLPKPFNPRELLARIRAILRRSSAETTSGSFPLRVNDIELDPAARTVLHNGKKIDLTNMEFALLEALMRQPGKVVSREYLVENVLGRQFYPFDRSLDMHVSRLRRKLNENDSHDGQVKTVRGTGYQLALRRGPSSYA